MTWHDSIVIYQFAKGIENWKSFYKNHHKYHKVGTVKHKSIDPSSPIPASCEEAIPQKPKKQ
jgi:hypothetical protein